MCSKFRFTAWICIWPMKIQACNWHHKSGNDNQNLLYSLNNFSNEYVHLSNVKPLKFRQENSSEQIKGMELTETILNYKPERPKKSVQHKSEIEDPLRSGLGYEGYMDCLLRGRRHRLTRKQWVSCDNDNMIYFSLIHQTHTELRFNLIILVRQSIIFEYSLTT